MADSKYIYMTLYISPTDEENEAMLRLLSCYPRKKTVFVRKLIDNFLREHGITDVRQVSDMELKKLVDMELKGDRRQAEKANVRNVPEQANLENAAALLSCLLQLPQLLNSTNMSQALSMASAPALEREPKPFVVKEAKPAKKKRTDYFQKKNKSEDLKNTEETDSSKVQDDNTGNEVSVTEADPVEETDDDMADMLDGWEEGLMSLS